MNGTDSHPEVMPDDVALRLPNTANGRAWLAQFETEHQDLATRLLRSLTLVSHSAFERAVQKLILAEAANIDGAVALYATREAKPSDDYFQVMADPSKPFAPLDAAPRGADLGSEVRIANLIRNLAKTAPDKLLNHPSLETLRAKRVHAIFVIDDFIGSGKRMADFITAMWRSPSVTSWHSRHQIGFTAIAYSGTDMGVRKVQGLKCEPHVAIGRDCPTLDAMPWRNEISEAVDALCDHYGRHTSRPGMRRGFGDTMAALVFEHGCPNNAPSILWAPQSKRSKWRPLFPNRAILSEQTSAFPPDIMARNPVALLSDLIGGKKDTPAPIIGPSSLGITTTTVLALVASGIRSRAALSYATGYDARACTDLLDRCVRRGYLTATLRLTQAGRAELAQVRQFPLKTNRVPPVGEDGYHPKQLRGPS